jgi:hypothetical protein
VNLLQLIDPWLNSFYLVVPVVVLSIMVCLHYRHDKIIAIRSNSVRDDITAVGGIFFFVINIIFHVIFPAHSFLGEYALCALFSSLLRSECALNDCLSIAAIAILGVVNELLEDVTEWSTDCTASIAGQLSVVGLSVNLDGKDVAAFCLGAQEYRGVIWPFLPVRTVLFEVEAAKRLPRVTESRIDGSDGRIGVCEGFAQCYLVHVCVRIVREMYDSALDVVDIGTAALNSIAGVGVARHKFGPSSLLIEKAVSDSYPGHWKLEEDSQFTGWEQPNTYTCTKPAGAYFGTSMDDIKIAQNPDLS